MRAFRAARSRNLNVLEALQVGLGDDGHTNGKLGGEATRRFLQSIGVGFDPGVVLEKRPTTDPKSRRPWSSDCSRPTGFTCDDCGGIEKGEMEKGEIRTTKHLNENVRDTPESFGGNLHAPGHLRENVPKGPGPSRATSTQEEQCQAEERLQQQDEHGKCASCETAIGVDLMENNEAVGSRASIVGDTPPDRRHTGAADGSNTKVVLATGEAGCVECGKKSVDNSSRSAGSAASLHNIGPAGNR